MTVSTRSGAIGSAHREVGMMCMINRDMMLINRDDVAGEWEDTRHKEWHSETRNAVHGWLSDPNPPNDYDLSH